ncbi:helix-turn-helix domain-containing protein [Actinoplanes sp. CA-051413]|uniref:helix-turn-helix domain-containing protein n=1 Tax=Actinoplanes sp. CA-051413 TaxID=3239899 RepID=UPI003D964B13
MNVDKDKQPRRGQWPYPGDSPLVRARRIAHMYRAQLRALNPATGDALDDTAVAFGETWVIEQLVVHQDSDLLPPADAAAYLCVSTDSLRVLRSRGRLTGVSIDGTWHYRFSDLRQLSEKRTRAAS